MSSIVSIIETIDFLENDWNPLDRIVLIQWRLSRQNVRYSVYQYFCFSKWPLNAIGVHLGQRDIEALLDKAKSKNVYQMSFDLFPRSWLLEVDLRLTERRAFELKAANRAEPMETGTKRCSFRSSTRFSFNCSRYDLWGRWIFSTAS